MKSQAISLDSTRHRLLEGVLLRLAQRPDARDFVLRGGMLLRHWFRPLSRPAEDLDLVSTFSFDVQEVAQRFLPVFTDRTVCDGVTFDTERIRVEGIWLDTGSPGARIFASGVVGEVEMDFHVDLTFGPPPRPDPVFGEIPNSCGQPMQLWLSRPETIVGQKIQALCHLGMLSWRPKDLNDLRLLLLHVPMSDIDLHRAIAAYLDDLGCGGQDGRALFQPTSWWNMKLSKARWLDFLRSSRGKDAPKDLDSVITEITIRLTPILESLP